MELAIMRWLYSFQIFNLLTNSNKKLFLFIGQVVFAMGGIVDNFTLMQLGRFVFGIGGESLAVAQNTYAVSWFKGKELNMVFGFQLSIARVGASVNFQVLSPLYNYISDTFNAPAYSALGWTLMISGSTCVMSFICSVILGWMDKRADRILKKSAQEDGEVVSYFWLLRINKYLCVFTKVPGSKNYGWIKAKFSLKIEFDRNNLHLFWPIS